MTLIHLVRHAEVENPEGVWYGRLEGFVLSERGRRQAEALAEFFSGHDLAAVYSSPLERTMQTAKEIAAAKDLRVEVDEDLLESHTHLQGQPGDVRVFRNPRNWKYFRNPFRPSWGEPYGAIRDRMLRAIERIRNRNDGREAVAVSHMTPILVARKALERDLGPAWWARPFCARASVTTLEFDGEQFVEARYVEVGRSVR